jgi:hypothetical protein
VIPLYAVTIALHAGEPERHVPEEADERIPKDYLVFLKYQLVPIHLVMLLGYFIFCSTNGSLGRPPHEQPQFHLHPLIIPESVMGSQISESLEVPCSCHHHERYETYLYSIFESFIGMALQISGKHKYST